MYTCIQNNWMKALGRTKFTDLVAHRYIGCSTQRGAQWFLAKVEVLYRRARLAVGRKFALYHTRHDLQVHWALRNKKLMWYNFGINIKLLATISSIVANKTLDGTDEVCVWFIEMSNKVKNVALANNYTVITYVFRQKAAAHYR